MIGPLAVIAMTVACLGAGALTLSVLGLWRGMPPGERAALAFAVGFGLVGWLMFWLGTAALPAPGYLWAGAGLLSLGALKFREPAAAPAAEKPTPVTWMLLALLALVLGLDAAEALAPPVDADTLAYHFELPLRFVEAGRVFFVPRATDGAIPLLVHMTYAAVLAMGRAGGGTGDLALTGWTFVSGWAAAALLYALARKWLGVSWSLALALLFQTLPAMIYGAGSGQMEARLAMFALAAAAALIADKDGRRLAPAVLLGLAAGFYAGGKYSGLIFAAAAGLALLSTGGRWLARGAVFGLTALAAGGQWYGWNVLHTGDPLFPMLFTRLGLADHVYWTADQAATFDTYFKTRGNAVRGMLGVLAYPFTVTFFPPAEIDSGRVGMGPFFVMALSAALLGLWLSRGRLRDSALLPVAVLIGAFYLLWINFGVIPKVRHLLPVSAPLLLCLVVAAVRGGGAVVLRPLALAFILTLAAQTAAQGLFARSYIKRLVAGEERDAFLARVVTDYAPVPWINANPRIKGLLLFDRQLRYTLDVPWVNAHELTQVQIDTRLGRVEPGRFLEQIRALGVTHILFRYAPEAEKPAASAALALDVLERRGCLVVEKTFEVTGYASRTLELKKGERAPKAVWRVRDGPCGIAGGGGRFEKRMRP